jgi:hypothetical protein
MTRASAEDTDAAGTGGTSRFIEEAIAAGWAWSVFSRNSSDGPLAWGIEVCEQAAVKRVEEEIRRRRNAAFGGIAGAGTEKVCQRTTDGGFRWRPVTSAT